MRIVRTIAEVRAAIRDARRAEKSVGLVPTMGAFHEGHLSLMRRAREQNELVVVSLFVNPTQFGANEDLGAYPRDEARDAALAEAEGVDILFAPAASEIYPDGFATTIHVSGLTEVLDGASRGTHHFDGVATVVTKLFGIVGPDVAYFGQKDAQQVLVVRRVVRDLDLDVRIEACPIVREADGLAMSSRNVYLDADARAQATALNQALDAAASVFEAGSATATASCPPPTVCSPRPGSRPTTSNSATRDPGIRHARPERCPPRGRRPRGRGSTDRQPHPLRYEGPLMRRTMLKSKIHRATVTGSDLHYVGSITVDPDLLEAADILPHEQVHVVDVDNGARFETYTLVGERGSGVIQVNGAAARLVHTGDTIIVISYADYSAEDLTEYSPTVVHVDRANSIIQVDDAVDRLLTEAAL